jgi:hypothetical protein
MHRHIDLIKPSYAYRRNTDYDFEQGFVDQKGNFLSRTEAWQVAQTANQIIRRVGGDTANGGTLYSENLY